MAMSISVTATNRVIALVDMDCFYVQVEERDDPSIKGIPAAVVQYKAYKGGGIIAVNYEARAKGVTRQMRGDDAKAVCPEIQLVRVPETRGKADLTKYRDASSEVIKVLTGFSPCVERASIDEAYIDLTEAVDQRMLEISSSEEFVSWQESVLKTLDLESFQTNFVLGYESTDCWFEELTGSEMPSLDDIKLAIGAEIVGKMRQAVYTKTGFRCSAGVAHNKVVAKFVCGMNKPNKQTVLPHTSVPQLWATTKIQKVRGLGGKLGDYLVERLNCEYMSDLSKFTEKQLCSDLGSKTGQWIYQLALGFDDEPVTPRQLPKSIGCNKNFMGPEALRTKEKVKFWISQLAAEVVERLQRDLEVNNRRAKTVTLHIRFEDQNPLSRSCGVSPNYNAERMAGDAYAIMEKLYHTVGVLPVVCLGLIASKFEDEVDVTGYAKINDFFSASSKPVSAESGPASVSISSDTNKLPSTDSKSSKSETPDSTSKPSQTKAKGVKSTKTQNPNSTLSRFLVKEPEPVPSTSAQSLSTSVPPRNDPYQAGASTSASSSLQSNLNTPSKSVTDKPSEKRETFFSFSTTVPKPQSPLKSPKRHLQLQGLGAPAERALGFGVSEKVCERCGKKVNEEEYMSHMDFHFAKDLSRELNGLPQPQPQLIKPETGGGTKPREALKRPRGGGGSSSSSSSKRGRPAKTNSAASSSRKIDSFFTTRS